MTFRKSCLFVLLLVAVTACGCKGRSEAAGLDALLAEGWQAYSTGDFDFAATCFQRVEKAEGATVEQAYSALLGLATTYHLQPNPDLQKARDCYSRLGLIKSDSARRQSTLGLARVDLAAGRTTEGQSKLAALLRDSADSMEADEAAIHLADSLLAPRTDESKPGEFQIAPDGAVQRGLNVLEDRLTTHPHNPLASSMHMMLANKYIELRKFKEAVEHLLAAEKEGIAAERLRSVALWRIARIAEEQLKDYGLAEKYYARYVDEFSRTTLYYRALKSLERVRALNSGRPASAAADTGGA